MAGGPVHTSLGKRLLDHNTAKRFLSNASPRKGRLTFSCTSDRLSPLLQTLRPVPVSFRVGLRAHARTLMLGPGSCWAASLPAPPHPDVTQIRAVPPGQPWSLHVLHFHVLPISAGNILPRLTPFSRVLFTQDAIFSASVPWLPAWTLEGHMYVSSSAQIFSQSTCRYLSSWNTHLFHQVQSPATVWF